MRRHIITAALLVLACGAHPALAQQKPGWQRQPTPFRGLFQTEDLKAAAKKSQEPPAPQRPRVVCGMTVIAADPNIDPKMRIEPKPGHTRYTIRAIAPPVCNSAKQ